jgi:hypothetical protein
MAAGVAEKRENGERNNVKKETIFMVKAEMSAHRKNGGVSGVM